LPSINETFYEKNEQLRVNGYKTYSKNHNNRKGGGMCILVQDNWSAKCVEVKDEKYEEEEILIIKIYKGKRPINIMTTYGRQENGKVEGKEEIAYQKNIWDQIIIEMQRKEDDVIWIGDLNVKVGYDDQGIKGTHSEITHGGKLLRKLIKNRDLQLINSPKSVQDDGQE